MKIRKRAFAVVVRGKLTKHFENDAPYCIHEKKLDEPNFVPCIIEYNVPTKPKRERKRG